jgi:hypothetical protein
VTLFVCCACGYSYITVECCTCLRNLVAHIKETARTDNITEQDTENNIWI